MTLFWFMLYLLSENNIFYIFHCLVCLHELYALCALIMWQWYGENILTKPLCGNLKKWQLVDGSKKCIIVLRAPSGANIMKTMNMYWSAFLKKLLTRTARKSRLRRRQSIAGEVWLPTEPTGFRFLWKRLNIANPIKLPKWPRTQTKT